MFWVIYAEDLSILVNFFFFSRRVSNEWARDVMRDPENITEAKVDGIMKAFLKDCKDGSISERSVDVFSLCNLQREDT